jgi:hypothetical protein
MRSSVRIVRRVSAALGCVALLRIGLLVLRVRVSIPQRPLEEDREARGVVCGADGVSRTAFEAVHAPSVHVLHAGACGACSNVPDIEVLRRTRATLTETSKACAMRYFLLGRAAAATCFSAVGLSPACTDCWLDDMACAIRHCTFVCVRSTLLGEANTVSGQLNACLACDEFHCGPAFARCAGASRRRAGIVSDIDRPASEVWDGALTPTPAQ